MPKGKGPYIEHYLIENLGNRKMHLEGSERYFSVIPMLICHYCQCLDELPVLLKLPETILNASRNQLNSLSLLSDKFWTTSFNEQSSSSDNEQRNKKQINEQNNNLIQNKVKTNSSDKLSLDEDRNSIETKELMFEEDEDHNFVKKEVFSESECEGELKLDAFSDNTEIKKHFLMEDQNEEDTKIVRIDDQIENQLDDLMNLKLNLESKEEKDKEAEKKEEENKEECPLKPPPRKTNLISHINISPPPLPSRDLKPVVKNYFKITSTNESLTSNQIIKPIIEQARKKSIQSNLSLLINFDVLEEEEKLIEQLKEDDVIENLNVINAQTQQLMSSQITTAQLNSDSSIELANDDEQPLLSLNIDQTNITKIEVNTDSSKIQEKLDELNLIELKLNESKADLDSVQLIVNENEIARTKTELLIEPLIRTEESIEIKPLIGQQLSLIKPLIAQKSENENKQQPIVKSKKIKLSKPKVETRDCNVQNRCANNYE